MASKLQVTPTKRQVTPTKLQVTPTKLQVTLTKLQVTRSKLRPVSNVEFCMHRIQFTLDSTAIVKFDVCFKRRI